MILIISFWLKGIVVKTEFQINQVLKVQFCLSLQNLLCKAFNYYLLCKYCKEEASVVIYFWIPIQKNRENTKKIFERKKNSSEKRKPKHLENDQELVEEV
jgi:hypothetical protein